MEVFLMKTTKEHIEKQINKHGKATVYSPESISLSITKAPYLLCEGAHTLSFEMDCADLADYCNAIGLTVHPTNRI
jgi:hypothetical protein